MAMEIWHSLAEGEEGHGTLTWEAIFQPPQAQVLLGELENTGRKMLVEKDIRRCSFHDVTIHGGWD